MTRISSQAYFFKEPRMSRYKRRLQESSDRSDTLSVTLSLGGARVSPEYLSATQNVLCPRTSY